VPVTTALAWNSGKLHGGWQTAGVVFVADALGTWLVEQLADAGRKKLTELILGSEQERALRRAADAAVWATAEEMSPADAEQAGQVAMVISEVFRDPVPATPLAGPVMLLEGLQAAIAGQLAVLDNAELTGTGQSSADVLGVPGTVLADRLTGHLVREIIVRGSGGGPLTPLADQLNHELTRLQGQRIEGMLAQLAGKVQDALARPGSDVTVAGRPLSEMTDPFALEVHRPIRLEDPPPGLPVLPAYVPRGHDAQLGLVVQAAAAGSSGIAVLVGGSSTGKTRACWEALGPLRNRSGQWRLWHPIDPARPDAALRELPGIGPRTVVWLNEAQFYLDVADVGLGERVAAGLRELLRDPARAPVLVLATLWPQFWDELTTYPPGGVDRHAQARELLTYHDITVPAAFTTAQLRQLSQAGDRRLALAAAGAQDGQVIQFLAGAPELLARYRNAPPAASALIHAAMDARRLGMGIGLPHAVLETAAPGYLTDPEWDGLGEDWLEQALAYTAVPCKGVRGPLTRIRPRPARSGATGPGVRNDRSEPADRASVPGWPVYRLADYLDQYGRSHRQDQFPPASFWAAVAEHALPGDQAALGYAASNRGLFRGAAQLLKNAAAHGDPRASASLINLLHDLHPGDRRPAHWAVPRVSLDDPVAVADLLSMLRRIRAQEQAAALARRAAAHAPVDDPRAVADLLGGLREAGSKEQAAALGRRAAAHAPLDDPRAVADLLGRLREAGSKEQAVTLGRRAAAQAPLDDPRAVADLLGGLREAGSKEQAVTLGRRAAAQAPLDDPRAVADLLGRLREAGSKEQAVTLGRRAAAHIPLDDPWAVADLLGRLREAGAQEQAGALACRAADHASLDEPWAVAMLLGRLREAGMHEQATALLHRDPAARVLLGDPVAVGHLLGMLQQIGAQEQAAALARRAAAHASLNHPRAVADLLRDLRKAGAYEQATALARRAAAHVPLEHSGAVADLLDRLREAGTQEQATALARRVAAHAPLHWPGAVPVLMDSLREAGAHEQVTILARRAAAHISLDDPWAVASLLGSLREAGAHEQAAALLHRDPAARVPLDSPRAVASLLGSLREAGAHEQAAALWHRDPAARVPLDSPRAVADLLGSLREAGAHEQVTVLADRAAAHIPLGDPAAVADLLGMLREAGTPKQVTMLARRAAAHASLDDPVAVADLLGMLRETGTQGQVTVLVSRLPGAGMFGTFRRLDRRPDRFRFGREADGSPAEPWDWDNLD
jgi:hypothetical protein